MIVFQEAHTELYLSALSALEKDKDLTATALALYTPNSILVNVGYN